MRPLYAAMATAVALLLLQFLSSASAHWKPEYASNPPQWQEWYETRQLTDATRQRLGVGFRSCCKHSDVVRTQFRVDRTSGRDEWWWLDGKTWKRLPEDVVQQGDFAPDGQPTLFVYQDGGANPPPGTPLCFFPGPGGI